jgi:hypothetical protein
MKAWKVQKVFGDIVYDLRSRGLLPVVILLVVAMLAVPILISRGSKDTSATLQPTAAAVTPPPETEQAVVSYHPPGLRKYQDRLSDQSPNDPFHRKIAHSSSEAGQLNSTVTPTQTGSSSASPNVTGPTGSTGSTGSTGTVTHTHHVVLFHSVADISFGDVSQSLQRHKSIPPYAMLPNQTAPVLVYLGSTLDEKRALFSVSKYTDQLTGSGNCAPGPGDCSLLAIGPGQTEDMVYAGDGKTYRLKINKIRRVVIKNPQLG